MSEKQMSDLLALVEKHLGGSWSDVIDRLRDLNQLDDIEARLAEGNEAAVVQGVQDAAKTYATEITAGYTKAAKTTATWLGEQTDTTIAYEVSPQAERAASKVSADLVHGLTEESRETVKHVIAAGVRDSRNPREIAKDIRSSIGLTPDQADAVTSYRKALEAGDYSNALGRELRDGKFDRTLAAAQRKVTPIDADKIDQMVDRYRSNYVGYRSTVIARTESLRAVHAGNEEMFRQAIDRGDIEADQLTRTWNTAGGPRVRASHRAMNNQKRDFGESFTTGDGVDLDYPGDPSAPIEETVQCRCVVSTTLSS